MFLLVAMRGNQVGAIGWAIQRDLAFFSATWGADFLTLGRTKSVGPAFAANRTEGRSVIFKC